MNGTNSCIILYGSSKSGKNYTLRGLENKEKGLYKQIYISKTKNLFPPTLTLKRVE